MGFRDDVFSNPRFQLGLAKAGTASRPTRPDYRRNLSAGRPQVMERHESEVTLDELYDITKNVNAVRKSIQSLRDHIFKNGFVWEKKFSRKCRRCQHEHHPGEQPDYCEQCEFGSAEEEEDEGILGELPGLEEATEDNGEPESFIEPGEEVSSPAEYLHTEQEESPGDDWWFDPEDSTEQWFYEPDETARMEAEEFFQRVDRNGHTLTESLKQFEEHLETADDGFLVVIQDYSLNEDGQIADVDEVRELFVADPRNFRMVQDPETGLPGGRWFICLDHRPRDPKRADHDDWVPDDDVQHRVYEEAGTCRVPGCDKKLHDVWYVSAEPGAGSAGVGTLPSKSDIGEFYVGPSEMADGTWWPGEVIHASKYSMSYGYGYSPANSIYDMAKALQHMERYIRTFYEEERTPRSAIFIPTRNPERVESVWRQAEDRNVSQEGHFVPKFTYDPAESNQGIQYEEFSPLPEEMQFGEVRDEFYRRIGSAWGVAPVFHGSVDTVGQMNQGPTQWQVTADAARKSQDVYNKKVFPKLLQILGIEGWSFELEEVEEQDEIEKMQVKMMKAQHAMTMMQLGFPPQKRTEEGEFEFPHEPMEMGPEQMGGGGGMGGGRMGGGEGGDATGPRVPRGPSVPGGRGGGQRGRAEAAQGATQGKVEGGKAKDPPGSIFEEDGR